MGPYRRLWRPETLITGKEDAANNYGRGYYSIGQMRLRRTMNAIRKTMESADRMAAFQLIHSYSGGTGSGMTSLVIDQLSDDYGKKQKFGISIFPSSKHSQSTVDPYNSVLHTHATLESLDCAVLVDNQTLFERATKNLTVPQPTFTDVNRMLAQMLSSIFLSHRYVSNGTLHADTIEMLTNLIPYPRIHFPTLFFAPIIPHAQVHHQAVTVKELTRLLFTDEAQTLDFTRKNSAYTSCALFYRGDVSPKEVYDALKFVKSSTSVDASFVDWCPTGFKVATSLYPPVSFPRSPMGQPPRSVCMLAGNLAMHEAWQRNTSKFDALYDRRAFVHWFIGEGLEEQEFLEAREDLALLEQDYEELASECGVCGENENNAAEYVGGAGDRNVVAANTTMAHRLAKLVEHGRRDRYANYFSPLKGGTDLSRTTPLRNVWVNKNDDPDGAPSLQSSSSKSSRKMMNSKEPILLHSAVSNCRSHTDTPGRVEEKKMFIHSPKIEWFDAIQRKSAYHNSPQLKGEFSTTNSGEALISSCEAYRRQGQNMNNMRYPDGSISDAPSIRSNTLENNSLSVRIHPRDKDDPSRVLSLKTTEHSLERSSNHQQYMAKSASSAWALNSSVDEQNAYSSLTSSQGDNPPKHFIYSEDGNSHLLSINSDGRSMSPGRSKYSSIPCVTDYASGSQRLIHTTTEQQKKIMSCGDIPLETTTNINNNNNNHHHKHHHHHHHHRRHNDRHHRYHHHRRHCGQSGKRNTSYLSLRDKPHERMGPVYGGVKQPACITPTNSCSKVYSKHECYPDLTVVGHSSSVHELSIVSSDSSSADDGEVDREATPVFSVWSAVELEKGVVHNE